MKIYRVSDFVKVMKEYVKITRDTMYKEIRNKITKIGSYYYISDEKIEEWLKEKNLSNLYDEIIRKLNKE